MAFSIGGGITIGGGISFVDGPAPSDPYWDNVTALLSSTATTPPVNNDSFVDSSTNNLTVTRFGSTTQGSFSPYGQSWSNYFDGTTDYLVAASNAAFAFGTGNYTIETWVFPTQQALQQILNFSDDRDNLDLNANGTINFFDGTGYTSTATYTVNAWNHIAYVRNSGTVTVYLNGTSIISTASSYNSASARSFTMGARGIATVGTNALRGYMSNIRVVKGSALYTTNFTPSTTPLQPVAGTSLLTCNNARIIDNSPNNIAITRNGDVSVQAFSPYAGVTLSEQYYGAYFDGNGDWLSITGNISPGDFTVEAWIFPTANNGTDATVFSTFGTSSPSTTNGIIFGLFNMLPTVGIGNGQFGGPTAQAAAAAPLNTWTHIAATRSGSTLTLWVNGVSAATTTASQTLTANQPILIGRAYPDLSRFFTGYISNLRVVSGTALYTTNFTPSTTPLTAVANTSLLTCQSSRFIDNSTNNFSITVNGDSRPSTLNPFTPIYSTQQSYSPSVIGGSGRFDGSGDYLQIANNAANQLGTTWTAEAWVYITSYTNINQIFGKGGSTTDWFLGITATSGRLYYGISTTDYFATTGPVVPLNVWNHVALVCTGSNHNIYLNGVLGATRAATTNFTSTGPLNIGRGRDSSTNYFSGLISDARLVKGTAVYTSTFAPPAQPLTAITNTSLLVNMTNAGIYDSAQQSVLATVGNTALTTAVKNFGNSSIAFDGTDDYMVAASSNTLDFATGDFTIELWANFSALSTNRLLLDRWASGNANSWQLYWRSTGTSITFLVGASTVLLQDPSTTRITTGTWNHIAVTRSGTTARLFINGVVVASATDSTSLSSSLPLALGIQYTTLTNDLNGYLSDVRITKGVARYTANFTPPDTSFPTY